MTPEPSPPRARASGAVTPLFPRLCRRILEGAAGPMLSTTSFSPMLISHAPVPEPQQYAVVAGLGLLGLSLWRRHTRR